jgi:predicted XRE-type DNA-binding protein
MGNRTIDWVVLGTEPTQGYVQEQETDMRLVRSIIEAVENHLQQNRLTLPPEKVSNIVSVLYDEITEAGSGQVNKGTVARLINLVK